ncbi:unnamed protein product [Porites evermanni]|uniref:TIR domain-containing protein n=1 Tax=Porites evermanni TaxID=104178 RepID=A0ABN8MI19_9CNID|nr:unnamed protein product [Porites evermanni]
MLRLVAMIETSTITTRERSTFGKRKIVLIVLLAWLIVVSIQPSETFPQKTDSLRLRRLSREESSKTRMRTHISLKLLLCADCLKGSKDHHDLIKQSVIYKQRKRKSIQEPQPSECPQKSPTAPLPDWTPEVNVSFGQYVDSEQWYINCSWTSMKDPHSQRNGILIRLEINEEDDGLIKPVVCFMLSKAATFLRINISSRYHYRCGDPVYLKVIGVPFVGETLSRYTPYPCKTHTATTESTTTSAPPSTTTSANSSSNKDTYAVSISVGILVGFALVAGLLVYFFRPIKLNIELPAGIKYHAFIAYSNEDKPWAEKILKLLEGKYHLKCCIHYRDFPVGRNFQDSMAASVYQSHKVIVLFSNNFVQSEYCKYELDVAIGRQVHNRDLSLVVIRIDGVDFTHLPSELRERSLIDYNDILQRPLWKKNLLEFFKSPLHAESHSDNGENGSDTTARVNSTTGDNSDSPLIV